MTLAANPRWHACRMLHRQDALAEVHLLRQGFRTFVPRILVTRRHARKFETRREPLFPRYAFVEFDADRQAWRAIDGTMGVDALVMMRDRPASVPVGVVETLLAATDSFGVIDVDRDLALGSMVRIVAGPLQGTLARLQRLDGKDRVELLLELVAGAVRVNVTRDLLEAV